MKIPRLMLLLLALAALFTAFAFAQQKPAKRALLVGINEYSANPGRFNLEGCENDVDLMRQVLVTRYGFEGSGIMTLKSRAATQENIKKAIRDFLVAGTKPGDVAVFYFSGHGTRVKGLKEQKESGYNQAICPSDALPTGNSLANVIIDKELGALLKQIRTKNLVTILDCCYSGDATKSLGLLNMPKRKCRFMQYSNELFDERTRYNEPFMGKAVEESHQTGWIAIGSCSPWEKAMESTIEIGAKEVPCGLMTKCLVRTLSQSPALSYEECFERVRRLVSEDNPYQTPMLQGPLPMRDIPFFQTPSGNATVPAAAVQPAKPEIKLSPALTLSESKGDMVTLDGGASAGITVGSEYGIFPPQNSSFSPQSRIGIVEITALDTLSSRGRIINRNGEIKEGCRALEQSKAFERKKLSLSIGNFPQSQELRERLKSSPYLTILENSTTADRLIGRSPTQGLCAIYARDWTLLEDFRGQDMKSLYPRIEKALQSAYLIKRFQSLYNPGAAFSVKLNLSQDRTRFKIGDAMGFKFRTTADCHLILAHISSDGNVTILFPNKYSRGNLVKSGQIYAIPPFEDGRFLFSYRIGGPGGQELVKAIATREDIDPWDLGVKQFESVFKEVSPRGDPSKIADDLLTALSRKLQGSPSSAAGTVSLPTGGAGWATDSLTYIIEEEK
jgi:hypothetical protein